MEKAIKVVVAVVAAQLLTNYFWRTYDTGEKLLSPITTQASGEVADEGPTASASAQPRGIEANKTDEGSGEYGQSQPPSVEKMVDGIHVLESSRGKARSGLHAYCRGLGKSNEYGYGGMAKLICFADENEARARVSDWVNRHLDRFHGDVGRTLCWYNLGKDLTTCPYYENYLRLK